MQSYSSESVAAIRGALIQAIYEKALRVGGRVALEQGGGVAAALMSTDVERVTNTSYSVYMEVFPVISQLVITIALLWLIAGKEAGITAIVTTFVFAAALPMLSQGRTERLVRWNKFRDRRTKLLAGVCRHLSMIKYSAIEPFVEARSQNFRWPEVEANTRYILQVMIICVFANIYGPILTIGTLVAYWLSHRCGAAPTTLTIAGVSSRPA